MIWNSFKLAAYLPRAVFINFNEKYTTRWSEIGHIFIVFVSVVHYHSESMKQKHIRRVKTQYVCTLRSNYAILSSRYSCHKVQMREGDRSVSYAASCARFWMTCNRAVRRDSLLKERRSNKSVFHSRVPLLLYRRWNGCNGDSTQCVRNRIMCSIFQLNERCRKANGYGDQGY